MKKLTLLFLIMLIVFAVNNLHANEKAKSVLILNSYHKGFPWTDNIVKGIESVLDIDSKNIEIKVEYMDTKAIRYEETYKIKLFEFLGYKYQDHRFDLIISSDDNAFNFLREFHEKLFPEVPIIVCGVNNRNAPDLVDPEKFTGILESTSHEETIELILNLHPQTKKIYLVIDKTPSGKYRWDVTEPSFSHYKGIEFIRLSDDYTITEIEDILKELKNDSIVIFFTLYRDKSGRYLSVKESASRITKASARPVYTTHLLELPFGVVGGKVLGGFYHGKTIADIGIHVLNGQKIISIPFLLKSPTQYIFDYGQLEKWSIQHSDLPEGSLILNKPFSVYDAYKFYIWSAISTISILVLVIFILQINTLRRKKAERAELESELKYRTLFENMAQGIFYQRADGKLIDYNQNALKMFGLTSDQFLGRTSLDPQWRVVHEDGSDFPGEEHPSMVALKTGKSVLDATAGVFNPVSKDFVWLNINAIPQFKDNQQKPYQTFVTMHDITKRKRVEKEISRSEKKYRTILQTAIDGFWITDIKGNILEVNAAYSQMSGYSIDELLTMNIQRLEGSEDFENVAKHLDLGIQKGFDRFESVHRKKDNRLYDVEINFRYLSEEELFVVFIKDISEQKEMQERILQAQKMESIGTLAGGIAHDFNNILSSILGFSDLALQQVKKGSSIEDDLNEIFLAGSRAKDLVRQILTFARKSDDIVKPVHVTSIAKEALKLIRSSIPTTIEIVSNIDSKRQVIGNPTQIHQIFMNLFTNSAHAMDDKGGTLKVDLIDVDIQKTMRLKEAFIEPGSYLKIEVSDTGIGISKDNIMSIFEPYFTTKDQSQGTGMGLAVVHGIVTDYEGKIIVDSKIGKGTTFTVFLPSVEKKMLMDQMQKKELPTGVERILFVDDEPQIIKIHFRLLKNLGYDVDTATSGMEALKLFNESPYPYDIIISDMTMPKMTGNDLAEQLLKINPDTKFILCTGYSKKINEDWIKQLGINALLIKPIDAFEMATTIRKILDE